MSLKYINFQSIPVTDQDRALAFYRDILGFTVHTDAPYTDDWRWIFLTLAGGNTKLQFATTHDIKVDPKKPALCLVSDDVDAEATRLRDAGVEITGGPDAAPWTPGVRWLMIRDTEGNLVLLESVKEG